MIRKIDERIEEDNPAQGMFRDAYTGKIFTSIDDAYKELLYVMPLAFSCYEYACITHAELIPEEDKLIIDTIDGKITYLIIECEINMPDIN